MIENHREMGGDVSPPMLFDIGCAAPLLSRGEGLINQIGTLDGGGRAGGLWGEGSSVSAL